MNSKRHLPGPGRRHPRVALYARGHNADSLRRQRDDLDRFVAQRSEWTVVSVYEEYASGMGQNRQKLQEILRDGRAGHFDIVVFQRIDRLARNLMDLQEIMEQLDEAGVAFYSAHELFESETASGRQLIQLIGALAELERRLPNARRIHRRGIR